jgi:hypothetical protein
MSKEIPLHLDHPERGSAVPRTPIIVSGWAVDPEAPVVAILVSVDDEMWVGARVGMARPDVAEAHPDWRGADRSGWRAELDLTHWPKDSAELRVVVLRSDGTWQVRARAPVSLRQY